MTRKIFLVNQFRCKFLHRNNMRFIVDRIRLYNNCYNPQPFKHSVKRSGFIGDRIVGIKAQCVIASENLFGELSQSTEYSLCDTPLHYEALISYTRLTGSATDLCTIYYFTTIPLNYRQRYVARQCFTESRYLRIDYKNKLLIANQLLCSRDFTNLFFTLKTSLSFICRSMNWKH